MLIDIKMPQMNGIEALKRIHEMYPEVDVIMLTAYVSTENIENIEQAKNYGAYGFIMKPFDIDDLRSYVDRVLSQDGELERRV